jgi:nucleolysin TIA-1/TIAR
MGMQLPGTWQGVPAQQIPATAQQLTQGVGVNSLPQTAGVVAYPMQQFQVSPQVLTPLVSH